MALGINFLRAQGRVKISDRTLKTIETNSVSHNEHLTDLFIDEP